MPPHTGKLPSRHSASIFGFAPSLFSAINVFLLLSYERSARFLLQHREKHRFLSWDSCCWLILLTVGCIKHPAGHQLLGSIMQSALVMQNVCPSLPH